MKSFFHLLAALFLILLLLSCRSFFEPQEEKINNPPNTTLANIPVDNDTLYASVTLQWDGEDNDGYIVAYEYRYTTYPLDSPLSDSISHGWQKTEKNIVTIPFPSPDFLNRQFFQ